MPTDSTATGQAGCGCNPSRIDLGHDGLGHRTSNTMARAGYLAGREPDVAAMTDTDLQNLGQLGLASIARLRERLDPAWPRTPEPDGAPPRPVRPRRSRTTTPVGPEQLPVTRAEADAQLAGLAAWSPWVPHADAVAAAPRQPGVYLAQQAGEIIYAGMAGPRDRNGKTQPKGLQGRLRHYAGGKALTSGLGEAVFARAIADPTWLRERLAAVEQGRPETLREWGHASFRLAGLELRWATTPDKAEALALEQRVIRLLKSQGLLWNQRT